MIADIPVNMFELSIISYLFFGFLLFVWHSFSDIHYRNAFQCNENMSYDWDFEITNINLNELIESKSQVILEVVLSIELQEKCI
jgi:hypothetical protein